MAEAGRDGLKSSIKIIKELHERLKPESLGDASNKHAWCCSYDVGRMRLVECKIIPKKWQVGNMSIDEFIAAKENELRKLEKTDCIY